MAIHLRLERVERGAEGLELARLAMDLLVGGTRARVGAKPNPNLVGVSPKPSPSPTPDSKPGPNLVGGVAVGEALEDGAGERVAVGGDERVAEGVGLLPW